MRWILEGLVRPRHPCSPAASFGRALGGHDLRDGLVQPSQRGPARPSRRGQLRPVHHHGPTIASSTRCSRASTERCLSDQNSHTRTYKPAIEDRRINEGLVSIKATKTQHSWPKYPSFRDAPLSYIRMVPVSVTHSVPRPAYLRCFNATELCPTLTAFVDP